MHLSYRLMTILVAFVVVTVLAGTGYSDGVDAAVLELLLPLRSPALISLFALVTLLGSVVVCSALAIALTLRLTAAEGRRGLVPLLLFVGLGVELVLKALVFQPGPPSELVHDSVALFSLRDLTPFTYPSGHAMRVTFLASLIAARYPRLGPPLWIVVGLVAFGRVYLAAGWITDVCGGVLLGLALATIAELVAGRVGGRRAAPRGALVTP